MALSIITVRLDLRRLLKQLTLSLGTGVLASLLAWNAAEQYLGMPKPFFAPPAFLFPLVWTILYLFLGAAAYLADPQPKSGLWTLYRLQLAANFLWPVLFFTANRPDWAFWDLVVLTVLVLLLTVGFGRRRTGTLPLLLPYLFWCLYALFLTLHLR